MLLNLKQLGAGAAHEEKAFSFDQSLDLSAVRLWGEHPFSTPVAVSGTVTCRLGTFTICYTAEFGMRGVCSRCLTPVDHRYKREYTHAVMLADRDGEDLGDFISAPDGELDLDELVMSDLLLEFGDVMLCGEGCRGLCPKCGKNLNDGDCGCVLHEPDPRFQALRDLLDANE